MQSAACGIIPASFAHFMEGAMLRISFKPSKIRGMSTPCACFTLYIKARTSSGTGYIRNAFRPRSSMCVCMPASCNILVYARTDSLGFSPASRLTCSNAPPLVSTRAKQPISTNIGAMRTNWSLRGWNFPELCHISL